MSRTKTHLLSILFLASLTILLYSSAFKDSFVYDDYYYVLKNASIRNLSFKSIIADFTDKDTLSSSKELSGNSWRPLATVSFALDYRSWRFDPFFYHVENVLLHSINAILVYAAAVLLFDDCLIAFIASVIFAIHPAQTEAVTWISGRSNQLFLLFFLSSFIFHIRDRMLKKKKLDYSLSLALFACGLLSKEMAVTLPPVFILYDLHFSKRPGIKDYANYYLPFFLVTASYLLTRYAVLGALAHREVWMGGNVPGNISAVIKAVAGYIRILILPAGLRVDYLVDIPRSIVDADTFFAILALFLVAAAWFIFRRVNRVSFCLGWFFITLLPVYSLIPINVIMAERFLYLPSVSFAFLTAIFLSAAYYRFKENPAIVKILVLFTVLILGLYSATVISRNREWKDDLSLFKNEVSRCPGNPSSHYRLGVTYAKEAREAISKDRADSYYKLAVKEFSEAARLKPDFRNAHLELANTYNLLCLYDLAAEHFKKAASLGEDTYIYNNLSISYWHMGMYDKAIASCKRSIRLDPSYPYPYTNLGSAYFTKHEYAKARRAWLMAVRLGGAFPALIQQIKDLPQ